MNLWVKEDVPASECILFKGKPVVGDPTNHKYEKRVRRWDKRLFSSGLDCYNADGIKVDGMFTLAMRKDYLKSNFTGIKKITQKDLHHIDFKKT